MFLDPIKMNRQFSSTITSVNNNRLSRTFSQGSSSSDDVLLPSAPPIHYAETNNGADLPVAFRAYEIDIQSKAQRHSNTAISGAEKPLYSNGSVNEPSSRKGVMCSFGQQQRKTRAKKYFRMSDLKHRQVMDVNQDFKTYFDEEYINISQFIKRFMLIFLLATLLVVVQNGMQIGKIMASTKASAKSSMEELIGASNGNVRGNFANKEQKYPKIEISYIPEISLAFITVSIALSVVGVGLLTYLLHLDLKQRYDQRRINRVGQILSYLAGLTFMINIIISGLTHFALPR
ncbi:hypothetical protein ACOME3_009822 [Neoechinorhynchus agilis]